MQRGVLPRVEEQSWPPDPFPSTFAKTLSDLEMPRFCRRYPALLTTLMKQMLDLVEVLRLPSCCLHWIAIVTLSQDVCIPSSSGIILDHHSSLCR